ncbi:MAG: hypothetical protein HRF51_08040 [bacterium]
MDIYLRPSESIKQLGLWAQKSTPTDACFLVNPRWDIFRAISMRSVFVTWKDGAAILWDKTYVKPWSERLMMLGYDINRETVAYPKSLYEQLRDKDIMEFASKQSIDYWVVPIDHPTGLHTIFHNDRFKVLEIAPITTP